MTDYTIDSFTNGKKSTIGAYVTDIKDSMEDINNSHSSAYSSLTNSTNEISDPSTMIQSPTPASILHSIPQDSSRKHRHFVKQNNTVSYGYNSCQSSPSSHAYQDDVTDLSNLPAIHDGYNSSSSSVINIGGNGDQKMARSSRDLTVRNSAISPTTSTSAEIRNIIDDYNATLRRATKEIKGKVFKISIECILIFVIFIEFENCYVFW